MAHKASETLRLPNSVVSRVDAMRLGRELETIDNFMRQAELRHKEEGSLPRLSQALEETVHLNQLNLLHHDDRERLQQFLQELKDAAPNIHMSFATEAPPSFTAKLVEWLRSEIHPLLLLDIGLQPSIAAGCTIRTTNKYFDCSVRQHLVGNRSKLVELIRSSTP